MYVEPQGFDMIPDLDDNQSQVGYFRDPKTGCLVIPSVYREGSPPHTASIKTEILP